MSKLILELDRLEDAPLEVLLAGATEIITDAWTRVHAYKDMPTEVEPVAYAANSTDGVRQVPVPQAPRGECNCPSCTMRRIGSAINNRPEMIH